MLNCRLKFLKHKRVVSQSRKALIILTMHRVEVKRELFYMSTVFTITPFGMKTNV